MNLADVANLPTVLDGHAAADAFGVSYWHLLELVKKGEAPVEPLRLGRRLVWPTARVLDALGIGAAPIDDERDGEPVLPPALRVHR